jgi:hypothetical protein
LHVLCQTIKGVDVWVRVGLERCGSGGGRRATSRPRDNAALRWRPSRALRRCPQYRCGNGLTAGAPAPARSLATVGADPEGRNPQDQSCRRPAHR